jgi:hypothetical protein
MRTLLLSALLLLPCATKAGTPVRLQDFDAASAVPVFLSSQAFTAVSSFSFNIAGSSNAHVDCSFSFLQNTSASIPTLTFNGDSTAGHYKRCIWGASSGGNIASCTNSGSGLPLTAGDGTKAGERAKFSMAFDNLSAVDTAFEGRSSFDESTTPEWFTMHWGIGYAGNSAPAYATVTASAGTMTGFARCWQLAY